MTNQTSASQSGQLREVARLFLKLGVTAFGGPAAHIGLMRDEVVRRHGWLSEAEFLDLLGATNLIPGPNSTEMAIHIGYRRAGWGGLLVGGLCFISPAALIVSGLAWGYVRVGKLPEVTWLLAGVKPVIIAVVAQALWGMGRTAIKTWPLAMICCATALLSCLGVQELLLLLAAGVLCGGRDALTGLRRKGATPMQILAVTPLFPNVLAAASTVTAAAPFTLGGLFLFFVKVGSVLFGSGYVLLAFLRADLVERWHWLSPNQLLDAVAIGQMTPGPLLTTATFIGYLLGGWPGAAVATVGIFLPAFCFVILSGPLIPRIRASPAAGSFLDGVNAASLALMAVVSAQLARTALTDWVAVVVAVVSSYLLVRHRLNSFWLIVAGAALGWGRYLIGR